MLRTYDDYGYSFDPVELYEMGEDPYQTRSLCTERPDLVERCSNIPTEWLQQQWTKPHYHGDPLEAILQERKAGS